MKIICALVAILTVLGLAAASPAAAQDTTAPSTPTNVLGTPGEEHGNVTWTASTDNVAVTRYEVAWRATGSSAAYTLSYVESPNTAFSNVIGRNASYDYRVAALDAAGNRSAQSAVVTVVTQGYACDKYASTTGLDTNPGTQTAPYLTVQKLSDSLVSGQVGCLRAGTYTQATTLIFRSANTTVASFPGERATINGYMEIKRGFAVKLMRLNLQYNGTGVIRVYGSGSVLESNDFTNFQHNLSGSCVGIGGSQDVPSGVVVRLNRFHGCGSNLDNQNHGIYALAFTDALIEDNVMWLSGGYSMQLYPNGTRATVRHNVIDGSNEYSVRGGIVIDGTTAVSHLIERNIIAYTKTTAILQRTGSGHVAQYNCFFSNTGGDTSGTALSLTGNVTADPLFINRAARDYRLSPTSGCLGVMQYDTAAKVNAAW